MVLIEAYVESPFKIERCIEVVGDEILKLLGMAGQLSGHGVDFIARIAIVVVPHHQREVGDIGIFGHGVEPHPHGAERIGLVEMEAHGEIGIGVRHVRQKRISRLG